MQVFRRLTMFLMQCIEYIALPCELIDTSHSWSLGQPTGWHCCDRKARAASAQSFTLWHQTATEIIPRDHSRRHHEEVQSWVNCSPLLHCWKSLTENPRSLHRDDSINAYSRHIYMGVILRVHPIRGKSHIQRNANEEVATVLKTRCSSLKCRFAICNDCGLTLLLTFRHILQNFAHLLQHEETLSFFPKELV